VIERNSRWQRMDEGETLLRNGINDGMWKYGEEKRVIQNVTHSGEIAHDLTK
jgi:hypothetical protein